MKKVILLSVIIVLLASCVSAEQRKLNEMAEAVKDKIRTEAFRDNAIVEFFEFTPIRYEVVSINYIDSLSLFNLWDEIDYVMVNHDLLTARIELNMERVRNYAALRWRDSAERVGREMERDFERSRELLERGRLLNQKDSIITANIANRVNPESIYLFTAFIKATITDNRNRANTDNILDTIRVTLNRDMDILRPRTFEDFY